MPTIDAASYNKSARYPYGHGYQLRGTTPRSIIVHSTSNPHTKNTAFDAEARFLFNSPAVSAHFLLGKDGRIVQFLDPRAYQAWHAGVTQPAYLNARSIGIELHHSVGDPPYPQTQKDALAWLLRLLMAQFGIPVTAIETHGQVAIAGPYKRKTDPSDWKYADFLQFRASLVTPPATFPKTYHCVRDTPIFHDSEARQPFDELRAGALVQSDNDTYPTGVLHLLDGRGFVAMRDMEAV